MAATEHGSESKKENGSLAQASHAIYPPNRGAFRKGALLATLLILPGLSALLHQLAREPLAQTMDLREVFVTVAIFAGLPALLVFGGIGKNVARQKSRRRAPMIGHGSLLGALAAIGIALLAAVPTATLPGSFAKSLPTLAAAALLGAATGALLGLWIHFDQQRRTPASAEGEA